jgi:hypothetical protein
MKNTSRTLGVKIEGQFEISREKCNNFLFTTLFYMNESYRELHNKSKLKIIKSEYVKGCPKWHTT